MQAVWCPDSNFSLAQKPLHQSHWCPTSQHLPTCMSVSPDKHRLFQTHHHHHLTLLSRSSLKTCHQHALLCIRISWCCLEWSRCCGREFFMLWALDSLQPAQWNMEQKAKCDQHNNTSPCTTDVREVAVSRALPCRWWADECEAKNRIDLTRCVAALQNFPMHRCPLGCRAFSFPLCWV